ncbi:sperm acrosome-associated protein 7 isoform X1 [Grammomys surdaster]|uniref:sperm acrosome-associated protein 7 isoform X1 n=1 Tax=Grammomys surdaster TaxID=491861 RepID=UPI0010A05998|nr:sperm acrosome-associated protein 7 isoform X1 [Grammomys surdaster]
MAANRRVETFLSVFLLCCWQGTELQPVKTTSDRITEGSLNSTTENIPEALDEILAKEILEPKTSAMSETSAQPRSSIQTTVHTKDINAGIDENYQEDAFENYHEFLENSEHSSTKKEKNVKNDRSTVENVRVHSSETKLEPHLSPEEKKSSNDDVYRKLSVLDKFLENIGQSEGSLELTESIF